MKRTRLARILTIFVLLGLLSGVAALTLTRWGSKDDEGSAMPKRPERRMVVEPRAEKSGEKSRIHYFDENNVEVETQVFYANGEKSIAKYRGDKTFQEYTRYFSTGDVKEHAVYGADGLTLVSGEIFRKDGTLLETTQSIGGGDRKQVKYWFDGKRVFAERLLRKDGSVESTYTRKDGTLWQKTVVDPSQTLVFVEDYDRTGKLSVRQEQLSVGRVISYFNADGKLYRRQTWQWNSSYYYPVMKIRQVDEIDPVTAKVTREIYYLDDGSVDRTVNFNADGTTTYRQMWDGKIDTETIVDAAGTTLSNKTLLPDTVMMETVDPELRREPVAKTPDEQWRLQELYPHYRGPEYDN